MTYRPASDLPLIRKLNVGGAYRYSHYNLFGNHGTWKAEANWEVDANLRLGFKADERDYGVGASIIREMGIKHMRLMTNNPLKRAGLEGYGLRIDEIVPVVIAPNEHNLRYLKTKEQRMHHTLGLDKQ